MEIAERNGLGIIASGTAPLSHTRDFELTALGRFNRMQQDYRFLVEDQLICGLQVHVEVPDRDVAVRVAQRVGPQLPILLAMSASRLTGTGPTLPTRRSGQWSGSAGRRRAASATPRPLPTKTA